MNVNTSSPMLAGGNYSRYGQALNVSLRDRYASTDNSPTARQNPILSSDAAMVEFSANGDVLEVTANSLLQLEDFDFSNPPGNAGPSESAVASAQSEIEALASSIQSQLENIASIMQTEIQIEPYASPVATSEGGSVLPPREELLELMFEERPELRDYLQQLRDGGRTNQQINRLEDAIVNLATTRFHMRTNEGILAAHEDALEEATAAIYAIRDEIAGIEANIEERENYLVTVGEQMSELEELILEEEERIDQEADDLEDRLDDRIERYETLIERRMDRHERRLERRLRRLERRQERHERRMQRREDREMNRRMRAEDRIAGLTPGTAEYYAAREAEQGRQAAFGQRVERWESNHARRMERATARFNRWNERSEGGITDLENRRDHLMEIESERIDALRQSSPRWVELSEQLENRELYHTSIEENIAALEQLLQAREVGTEEELRLLYEAVDFRNYQIVSANETLREQRYNPFTGLIPAQSALNDIIEEYRNIRGWIV